MWTEEMEKAVEAYRQASKFDGGNGEVLFHLAVALEVRKKRVASVCFISFVVSHCNNSWT